MSCPNKLDLKFSTLQTPKQESQVNRKSCRSSNLEPSALFTVDINSEASDKPEEKGQETERASLILHSSCSSVFSGHTQNPQGKSSTKMIVSVAPPSWKLIPAIFRRVSRHFESDSLLCIQPDSRHGPGGFSQFLWPKLLNSHS